MFSGQRRKSWIPPDDGRGPRGGGDVRVAAVALETVAGRHKDWGHLDRSVFVDHRGRNWLVMCETASSCMQFNSYGSMD